MAASADVVLDGVSQQRGTIAGEIHEMSMKVKNTRSAPTGEAAENMADKLFDAIDTDGSGTVTKDEFRHLYEAMGVRAAKKRGDATRAKRLAYFLTIFAGLLCVILGASIAANFAIVDSVVRTTTENTYIYGGSSTLLTDKKTGNTVRVASADFQVISGSSALVTQDETVVGTREETVSLPLMVAPVMTDMQLASIRRVFATYRDAAAGKRSPLQKVTAIFTIIKAVRYDNTYVMLTAISGERILIHNGDAYLLMPNGSGGDVIYELCESNTDCAALKAKSNADVDDLTTRAYEALVDGGLISEESVPGRRLEEAQTKWVYNYTYTHKTCSKWANVYFRIHWDNSSGVMDITECVVRMEAWLLGDYGEWEYLPYEATDWTSYMFAEPGDPGECALPPFTACTTLGPFVGASVSQCECISFPELIWDVEMQSWAEICQNSSDFASDRFDCAHDCAEVAAYPPSAPPLAPQDEGSGAEPSPSPEPDEDDEDETRRLEERRQLREAVLGGLGTPPFGRQIGSAFYEEDDAQLFEPDPSEPRRQLKKKKKKKLGNRCAVSECSTSMDSVPACTPT